jgi:hypothetical protein
VSHWLIDWWLSGYWRVPLQRFIQLTILEMWII